MLRSPQVFEGQFLVGCATRVLAMPPSRMAASILLRRGAAPLRSVQADPSCAELSYATLSCTWRRNRWALLGPSCRVAGASERCRRGRKQGIKIGWFPPPPHLAPVPRNAARVLCSGVKQVRHAHIGIACPIRDGDASASASTARALRQDARSSRRGRLNGWP